MRCVAEVPLDYNSPTTLAAENDREWFEDHPNQFIRVRYKTDGDPGKASHVMVFSPLKSNTIRFRIPFRLPRNAKLPTQEAQLVDWLRHLMWSLGAPPNVIKLLDAVIARGRKLVRIEEALG
jgi:hypothetical protein